ncbi:MAG: hypothetical protein ACREV9_00295 [Burkholderiales bacterium]
MRADPLATPWIKTGVIVLDAEKRVVFANAAALELFDSRNQAELHSILATSQHELDAALASGAPQERTIKLDARGVHLQIAPGAGDWVIVAHDVAALSTLRKCMKAASLMRAKERMSGTLLHGLKGPMHSITLTLDVLRRFLAQETRAQQYLEAIGKDITRFNSAIEATLADLRPVAETSEFELRALIQQVCANMRIEAAVREVHIKVNAAEGVMINGRRKDIEHALATVLLNALETSEEGAEIEAKLTTEERWARITVSGGETPPSSSVLDHEIDLEVAAVITRDHGGDFYADSNHRVCFKFPLK